MRPQHGFGPDLALTLRTVEAAPPSVWMIVREVATANVFFNDIAMVLKAQLHRHVLGVKQAGDAL